MRRILAVKLADGSTWVAPVHHVTADAIRKRRMRTRRKDHALCIECGEPSWTYRCQACRAVRRVKRASASAR